MPGGALMQLVAYGASDNWYMCRETPAMCANTPKSCSYWFLGSNDGEVTKRAILGEHTDNWNHNILHSTHVTLPFNVKLEKAATRIQARFRECISNPRYAMCRRRLLREFEEMNAMDQIQ